MHNWLHAMAGTWTHEPVETFLDTRRHTLDGNPADLGKQARDRIRKARAEFRKHRHAPAWSLPRNAHAVRLHNGPTPDVTCSDAMTKIEDLLQIASTDPRASAWNDLYQEVCHQGDCYPDGFFLVPLLAGIATGFEPEDRDNVLSLAGDIAVDLDEASRDRYAEALATLRRLWMSRLARRVTRRHSSTASRLSWHWKGTGYRARTSTEYSARNTRSSAQAAQRPCSPCSENTATSQPTEDYAITSDVECTPLLPVQPSDMDGLGLRLHSMSINAGQGSTAEALTYVFGHATCTRCNAVFRVADRVGQY